ncbi:MAG: alpha/beta hydrolase [Holosporales bacterium]|jgi:alpha/beta superfamily hydrolase|nr:alpha/beta hydrolase [Holosporales bacterium]
MPQVIFNGPSGRLEGRYHHSDIPETPVALILHPHPLQGGTMNNRVTYTLYRAFAEHSASVLRFNFRGVGRSEGAFENGEGELADAAAALDWVRSINQGSRPLWVAGFSFGALIAMQLLMRRPEVAGFISVSPQTNLYDFNFLAPCPVSGMILYGKKDTIVQEETVERLVAKLNAQKGISIDYRVVPNADHFYTNDIEKVYQHTVDYVSSYSYASQEPKKRFRVANG